MLRLSRVFVAIAELKKWAASTNASLVMVKRSCVTRHETNYFAADIVGLLKGVRIPVIWTLRAQAEEILGDHLSR